MSTTVDQRVVEMKFDNQHFERNVSTTMSTLDKLKQKLKFSGSSKGLEGISTAAKNVNLAPLSNAAETVGLRFNAMYTMADQALRNITNSAMRAGKNIVDALTIDPVKTGLSEYETQINAIQTILSNTESKGTTIDDVTSALDELNEYADMTIYNFTEMTRNIGTFTAAGVDLDTSVNAIKGIANLAAVSGSTSQQASTAMYQLSQAMASGSVKLMDWNSVVNAGMGGQVFQDALKETAKANGINVDAMIKHYGSFRETLTEGWITTEILTDTLQKFTMTTEGCTEEQIKANREMLKAKGYTDEQIDAIFKLGKNATEAATKVKTFSQLWDTLKETAQSGWTQSWELIFGDFYEARDLFSGLYETISKFIDGISDARNKLLEGALGSKWSQFAKEIEKTGVSMSDFQKTLGEVTKEHNINLDELITEYGSLEKAIKSGKISTDMIIEAMKRVAGASEQSVEALAKEDEYLVKKGDCLWRIAKKYNTTWQEIYKLNKDIIDDPNLIYPEQLLKLPEAQLESLGYTKEQINAMKALAEAAEETNSPVHELISDLQKPSGRELLVESVKNAVNGLLGSLRLIGEAWHDAFPPMSSNTLYKIIEAIHKFSTYLVITEDVTDEAGNTVTRFTERGDKLLRVFKGIFAILDVITTIIGGGFKIALKVLSSILGYFNMDLLDVAANIGDAIVGFRDWFDSLFDVSGILEIVVPILKSAAKATATWFKKLAESETVGKLGRSILSLVDAFKSWFSGMIAGAKEADNIPKYIIDGLINGFKNGAGRVASIMFEMGTLLLDKIREVLGIHSPSTEFFEIAKNCVMGFVNGIKNGLSIVWDTMLSFGKNILDSIKNMDLGQVIAIAVGVGMFSVIHKIANAISNFSEMFSGLNGVFEAATGVLESFSGTLNSFSKSLKAKALRDIAIGILLLAAAVIAISYFYNDNMWKAVLVIGVLAAMLLGLAFVLDKLNSASASIDKNGVRLNGLTSGLLGLSVALLVIALTVNMLGNLDENVAKKGFKSLLTIVVGLIGMFALCALLVKGDAGGVDKLGRTLFKLSLALAVMVLVVKLASNLKRSEIDKGLIFVYGVGALFTAFVLASEFAGEHASKAGGMLVKMSIAMLIMIGVVKLAASLEDSEIKKGFNVVVGIAAIFAVIIALSKIPGGSASGLGTMFFGITTAILAMIAIVKLASMMSVSEIKKGLKVIAALSLLIGALIAVSYLAGEHAAEAGKMLLNISIALLILTGVIFLLSQFDPKDLSQGLGAIVVLEGCFAGLIAVTKLAKNGKAMNKTLLLMMAAIALMVGAVVGLSFLDPKKIAVASAAISLVIRAFATLIAATKFAKSTKTTMKTLLLMTGVIVVLAGIVALLSLIDTTKALPGVAGVSILMLSLAASLAIMGKAGKISSTVYKRLFPMLLVIAGLAAIVVGLSWGVGDVSKLIPSAIAIGILMNAMASALLIMSTAGKISSTVSKQLYPMIVVALGLGAILTAMSWGVGDVSKLIPSAIALGILMNAMASSLLIMSFAGKISSTVSKQLYPMTVVALGLGVILALMSWGVGDVSKLIPSAIALGILMNAMASALLIMSFAGAAANKALPTLGVMTLVVAGLGIILGLMSWGVGDVSKLIPMALAISVLLLAMSGAMLVCAVISGVASMAMTGLIGLAEFVVAFAALVIAIGGILDLIPDIELFIDKGIGLLVKLAHGLGEIIGAIIAGFVDGAILGIMPDFADSLSDFMTRLTPFVEGASAIKPSMMAGIKTLAEVVLMLTAANILDGISRFFGLGSSSLATFGVELGHLGTGLKDFAKELDGFTEEDLNIVQLAAQALKTLAEVSKTIPNSGGLLGDIVGNNDLGTFADQFPNLGKGLRQFLFWIGTFTDAEIATVNCAAEALKTLASAAKEIPNTGGLLGDIVGNNDLGTFADQFPKLGKGIRQFLFWIGTFSDAEVATVTAAAKAVESLASASKNIPNSGGLLADIVGNNDLGTFAEQFPKLGKGIRQFLFWIGTLNAQEVATVNSAAKLVETLAGVAKNIPNQGGWLSKIVGDNDLGTFASQFPNVGAGIKGFADKLGSFDSKKISTINAGLKVVASLTQLSDVDMAKISSNVTSFNANLTNLGSNLSGFVTTMTTVTADQISLARDNIQDIVNSMDSLSAVDGEKAKVFSDSLVTLATSSVTEFLNTFTKPATLFDVEQAAINLVLSLRQGLESETRLVGIRNSCDTLTSTMKIALRSINVYNDFKAAGSYLVDGFKAGITAKTASAVEAARSMALSAAAAVNAALGISSPSKVLYKAGSFGGQGFVNALIDYARNAYKAGSEMGKSAKNGLTDAIGKISNIVSDNIDVQPTIRPVLDLSDVQAGARTIGGMFGSTAALAVQANVGSISAGMAARSQNGANDDVIGAIDKLREAMGDLGNTSYTINGITYDDGSNINEAVSTLIRAAKIERRV